MKIIKDHILFQVFYSQIIMCIWYENHKSSYSFSSFFILKSLCVLTTLSLCVFTTHFFVWPKNFKNFKKFDIKFFTYGIYN